MIFLSFNKHTHRSFHHLLEQSLLSFKRQNLLGLRDRTIIDSANNFINHKKHDNYYEYLSACRKKNSNTLYTNSGLRCEKDIQVALGRFRNAVNETGWGILEVETFNDVDEMTQAFAAGLLEGVLTRQLITYHFRNTVEEICDGEEEYCKKLFAYLSKNLEWIKRTVSKKTEMDIYWKQVNLTFAQLTGINYGYLKKASTMYKPIISFELTPIYMIQLAGEVFDLEKVFGKNKTDATHCSGLIKLAPDNADLFIAHVSMSSYETMNRILKFYKFAFDKEKVPGYATSFSSYPGVLASLDDFILASSGLAIIETTISIFNHSLYNAVRSDGQLHCWIRSIIATKLANTAKQWMQIFARYNSGTYNNQWSVLDYKLFKPNEKLPTNNLLWVLEQTPGLVISHDMTWFLKNYTYWPSYNIPYFKIISEISGFKEKGQLLDWYKWESCPRAKIFKRDHHKVINLDTLQKLMRYNDYKHDEFSKCKCIPPYSAEASISTRGDLNPPNGTYEINAMGHRNHGSIDYKGTNYHLFKNLRFKAWGGPPYDPLPVFSWATTNIQAKHYGQPTVWQFKEIETQWETVLP
ncbi:Phospholipase B family protein [Acanthocheilonema viteae]